VLLGTATIIAYLLTFNANMAWFVLGLLTSLTIVTAAVRGLFDKKD
jgi:hypothetical protein